MFLYALSHSKENDYNPKFLYDGYELLSQNAFNDEYTIMINAGYIGLDYSIVQNCIVGISGVCPKTNFLPCYFDWLPFDSAQIGKVYIQNGELLPVGHGCQLPYQLKPMFDGRGILSFQNKKFMSNEAVRVACSNSLVVSIYDEEIAAVWVRLFYDRI